LIAPAIAAVFLMGVFNRKITPKAGQWGLLVGFTIGMIRLGMMIFKSSIQPESFLGQILAINWLVFEVFLLVFTICLMVVISFFTPKAEAEQLRGLTYFSQTPEQKAETRNSWSTLDIVTSLGVVAICAVFYFYFW
jgi:SSS family solute:Na+ symporter